MRVINSISLVVPSYKQEKTIVKNIQDIENALSQLFTKYEIIVVVDGFEDETYKNIKKIQSKKIKIMGYPQNKGKGYAVRHGMKTATGDVVGFIDAGMDIDPTGIAMLLSHMNWYKADIIVGSKLHPVSQVEYPVVRRVMSWGYRTMTRILFGFKIRDTQVGLKIFRRQVAKKVFPKLLVKKFAFDIEILAVAYSLGYTRIYEAPIKLTFKKNTISSKNFWRVVLHTLWDTMAVYYRIKVIHYYKKSH